MIKHNLLELLEDGETVVPLAGARTPYPNPTPNPTANPNPNARPNTPTPSTPP